MAWLIPFPMEHNCILQENCKAQHSRECNCEIWGGEVVFIMKSIICHESSKGMGQFEDESLTAHCQDKGIVFNVKFQTSIRHSRIFFSRNFELRKVEKSC